MPTLCTLETLKHVANYESTDSTVDGVLIGILEAVEERFIGECGWGIATSERTEHFSGNGKTERTFSLRPVTAIASLATQGTFSSDTWTAIPTESYRLRSSAGRSYITYPAGFGLDVDYRVVYTVGYADDAIPADIQLLIATFAAIEWLQWEKGGKGLLPHQTSRAASGAGMSVTENFSYPIERWNKVVQRYRIIPCV